MARITLAATALFAAVVFPPMMTQLLMGASPSRAGLMMPPEMGDTVAPVLSAVATLRFPTVVFCDPQPWRGAKAADGKQASVRIDRRLAINGAGRPLERWSEPNCSSERVDGTATLRASRSLLGHCDSLITGRDLAHIVWLHTVDPFSADFGLPKTQSDMGLGMKAVSRSLEAYENPAIDQQHRKQIYRRFPLVATALC